MEMLESSDIANFYEERSVFITGATGFMGKVLVEKLLRSCPRIKYIFLLMRPNKDNSNTRLQNLIKNEVFDGIREKNELHLLKCVAVSGDVTLPGFGLSDSDRNLLCENVSIVFNLAATVRFDEDLKTAIKMNVMGPRELLKICKDMKYLKALVHVSTAFNNLDKDVIEEVIYKSNQDPIKLVDFINESDYDLITEMTPELIGKCPNTYTYTKALAEQVLEIEKEKIPLVIVRPSIVTAALKEPQPGWMDNLNGPTGLMTGCGKGFLRVFNINDKLVSDIIPVDYPINLMIAVAWHMGLNLSAMKLSQVPVYSSATGFLNPFTWGELKDLTVESWRQSPTPEMMWYPSALYCASNWWFKICMFIFHIIPAFLLDIYQLLSGQRIKWVKRYIKVHSIMESYSFFTTHSWKFISKNQQVLLEMLSEKDRDTFYFDVLQIHWPVYVTNYVAGIKRYILKDDSINISRTGANLKRLKHLSVLTWLVLCSFMLVLALSAVSYLWLNFSSNTSNNYLFNKSIFINLLNEEQLYHHNNVQLSI